MFDIESGWFVLNSSDFIGPGPFATAKEAEDYITEDGERVEFLTL